jgi:polysaccharide biosynthesis transport protein
MRVPTAAGYEARLSDVITSVRDVLRRRYLLLLIITLVVTVIGVVLSYQISPSYQGVTRVQIDPSRTPLEHEQNEAQAQLASEAIETEVSVINSADVARSVVQRLGLLNDPEFAPQPVSGRPPLSAEAKLDSTVQAVQHHLAASRDRLTYIIVIRFNSRDPHKAARIANAFANAYLDQKVGTRIGTAERQEQWFQNRMNEFAGEVRAADDKVAEFQAKSGIVRGAQNQQGTVLDQQIGPLSLQMASAEAVAAEARSKAMSAQTQVAQGHLDSVTDVRQSPVIQELRRERATVVQTMQDMQLRYGDRYPDLIKVQDQLKAIDQLIKDESARVMRSLNADASAAEAQAGSLRGSMSSLEQKQADSARASVIAASLQRDADSKHAAYDKMAEMLLQSRQAAQNSIAQARVVDSADAPLQPSWPNRPLLFLLAFAVGLSLGVAVITMQELTVSGFRSVDEVEATLGVPLIAAVPDVKGTTRPADQLIEKPTSQFAESLRIARAAIIGVRGDQRPKVIALTSALPNEGKTTTVLGLARTMALNGDRTIVIDADVRRAQLRRIVGEPSTSVGLVDVLHGDATLDQAITSGGVENLDQILTLAPYFTSENLFGNDRMPQLLEELSHRYDSIILDLPPLVGLADGRYLAALADSVALIVKWDSTPKHAVESAVSWLRADNANLVGSIFTMVDTGSHAVGAYYYYSKKYSAYYDQGK